MSTHAGHKANIGYTRLDAKNYLKAKRQRNMVYGEVGCLLQCFQQQLLENPSFFHAYQMNIDEQITNVLWADAKMVLGILVMLSLWILLIVPIKQICHLLCFQVLTIIGVL